MIRFTWLYNARWFEVPAPRRTAYRRRIGERSSANPCAVLIRSLDGKRPPVAMWSDSGTPGRHRERSRPTVNVGFANATALIAASRSLLLARAREAFELGAEIHSAGKKV